MNMHCFPIQCIKIVLLTILGCVLASCATGQRAQQMADVHVNTGIANLESGHYTAALKELFEARRLNPQDPRIPYYLGVSYYGKGLPREAAAECHKALEMKPDYSEAYNFLGLIYFEKANYKKSIECFTNAISNILYETPEFALNNLGRAYFKMGDYETALVHFKKALKIRPNKILPIIHMNTGALLLAMNRVNEAVHHLERSIEIAPYIAEAHYRLGKGYLLSGDKAKAVKELKTALTLNPQSEFGIKSKDLLLSMDRQ